MYCENCINFKNEKCSVRECEFPLYPSKEYIESLRGVGNIYSSKISKLSKDNRNALWAETMQLIEDVYCSKKSGNPKKPTKEVINKARDLRILFLSDITNVAFIKKRKEIIFY